MTSNWSRTVNRYADNVLLASFEHSELRVRMFWRLSRLGPLAFPGKTAERRNSCG
jgi:hypothetical protein